MAASTNYLGFNVSPTPTSGTNAYGLVPGQTAIPPSTFTETNAAVPGLSGLTTGTSGVIGSELGGTLSPGTMQTLQNNAAAFGVGAGTPLSTGSNLPLSQYLQSIGQSSESLANTGVGNYMNFLGGVGSQQLAPSLVSGIGQTNAQLAAAPSPQAATTAAQQWQELMMEATDPGLSFTYPTLTNPASGVASVTAPNQATGGATI